MTLYSKFDRFIESQNWDHTKFLRNLLILLGVSILFFYLWILLLYLNHFISSVLLRLVLKDMLEGHLTGIVLGLIFGFFQLLPLYRRKLWDLHIVVPRGLAIHLLLSAGTIGFFLITDIGTALFQNAFVSGFLIGGLIPILAYCGEVNKEHTDTEIPLLEDED